MLTKITKLFTRTARTIPLRFAFTTNSQKLQMLLQKIEVENEAGKTSGLLESGLIAGQHIDPESSKVTISLNLSKDYRRIKSLIKN